MDIAQLQLTIDGRPAIDEFKRVEQAALALQGTAISVAASISAAFAKINVQTATSQTGQLTTILQQMQGTLNSVLISTNSLNLAMGTFKAGNVTQQAQQTNSSLVNMASSAYLANMGLRILREGFSDLKSLVDATILFDRFNLGMATVYGGARQAAAGEQFLFSETDRLGLKLEDTMPQFVKISAAMQQSGFSAKETRDLFTDIGTATKSMGLSTAATGRILYDFQEMASLGTVQLRQLRQVIMQVPGGLEIAARAMGVTTEQFLRMVHAGQVGANDFIPKFGEELKNTFGSQMGTAADNMESAVNRMGNAWLKFKGYVADGAVGDQIKQFLTVWADIVNKASTITPDAASRKQAEALTSPNLGYSSEEIARSLNRKYAGVGKSVRPEEILQTQGLEAETQSVQQIITLKEKLLAIQEKQKPDVTKTDIDATQRQLEAQDKLRILIQETNIERLTGLQKENALIDLNTLKKAEEFGKLSSAAGSNIFEQTLGYADIFGAGEAAKKRNNDVAAGKRETKDAEELTGAYREMQSMIKEMATSIRPENEQAIARENERYSEQYRKLISLTEIIDVPESMFTRAAANHQAILDQLHEKDSRRYIDEENILDIQQKRLDLENNLYAAMQKPDNDKQVSQIQEQIRAASQKERIALATNSASPMDSLLFGLKEAKDGFGTLDERIAQAGQTFTNDFANNVSDGFMQMINGSKSAGDAIRGMIMNMAMSFEQAIIKEIVVKQLLQSMIGSFGGTSTQTFTGGGSTGPVGDFNGGASVANISHEGGLVGAFGRSGSFGRGVFSGAPRFHTGGVVGDEMPIIAKRGEVVFTPEQMTALGNAIGGSRGKQKPINMINTIDPRFIADSIAADPEIILNVIGSKRTQVNALLGLG